MDFGVVKKDHLKSGLTNHRTRAFHKSLKKKKTNKRKEKKRKMIYIASIPTRTVEFGFVSASRKFG